MKKETIHEIGEAVVKSGVGLIPYVGPLFSELIGVFSNKKAKQRFEKWANLVEERLSKLETKIDETNENFYSAMVKTTQIVAKTHQDEKLEYLANALINSADDSFDEDLNQYFLDLVEKYTPSHIKTLKTYSTPENPNYYFIENENSNNVEIKELRHIFSSQLAGDSLVGYYNGKQKQPQGMVLMPLGEKFLEFISDKGVKDDKNEG